MRIIFSKYENCGVAVGTFERGIQILMCFEEVAPPLSVEQLAAMTNLPISTLYRYVQSLVAENLLEPGPRPATYVLGHRFLSLARKVPGAWDMAKIAYPEMKALSDQIQETLLLLKRSGDATICIERVEADQVVKFSFEKGKRLPLHAGASARIVMAYLAAEEIDRLLQDGYLTRYTENTITARDDMKRILEETRLKGYAISTEEMDPHVRAIAVPILDSKGDFLAGMSVVGPTFRLNDEKIQWVLSLLKDLAGRLSVAFERHLVGSE